MATDTINNDFHVNGALSCNDFTPPDGCIDDEAIEANAQIDSSKLMQRFRVRIGDANATTAAAKTEAAHMCLGATGTILRFSAAVHTLMSAGGGDDKTVTFDVKNSAGTSLLLAAVTIDKTKAAKTKYDATINTPNLVAGDYVYVTIAVAGSTGTQATGAACWLEIEEAP